MEIFMLRATQLRQKEVINVSTGARLGFVSDVEVNFDSGKIDAIIVPGQGRFFGLFAREKEHVISWDSIVKVGDDIILVKSESF